MASVMTNTAAQKPPNDGKMARQPKLTTKSGMPSGMTTRTAQRRRPGRSVRSMNHASRVPRAAQSKVTTTVSLIVFHSSSPVRLRNSSGCSIDHPIWKASMIRNSSGAMTTTATARAAAIRAGGPER